MHKLVEVPTVEETKHLVPNLAVLTEAVFGKNAFLVDWRGSHGDWATLRLKFGDGLIWLPWLGQLWLVEVEWKEGSNFFDQARAFAKGKVDSDNLKQVLRRSLHVYEKVLNEASATLRDGLVVDSIVRLTMENHVKDSHLMPHGWVILGHDGDNTARLRETYGGELKVRFCGKQQYILSMARLFQNEQATYILLEQSCSERCTMRVEPSLLIPAGFERAPRPQRGTGREEADPSTNRENPRDGKAGRFYILNTNCKNGTTDHEDMIQNRKAAAYFDPWKRKIEQLGKGDTVLLYQNGVGIVAMGRASGKLEKAAYHGDAKHKDEEYFMGLEPFEHVDPPLSAAKVKDLTGKDFRFLQTMFSVDSDSAAAIVGYIQNQRSL